ncbi:hypothetical protein [Zoogloea sp.]|uniref:hypothetical protein n=1 Tax=Zoogloea sp. TaxID=49181 RepID=UPI00262C6157|nr:hypothetical protein [uncultured Zoogloea sp.]
MKTNFFWVMVGLFDDGKKEGSRQGTGAAGGGGRRTAELARGLFGSRPFLKKERADNGLAEFGEDRWGRSEARRRLHASEIRVSVVRFRDWPPRFFK